MLYFRSLRLNDRDVLGLCRTGSSRASTMLALFSVAMTTACGGGGGTSAPAPIASTYSVGGSISGLTAEGLTLSNGSDQLTVPANASGFSLPTMLASGAAYSVTVGSQPIGLACQVSNASGAVGRAPVTSIAISCTTARARFAYVANQISQNVSTYSIDGITGQLTQVGTPLAIGGNPYHLTAGVSGKHVWVLNATTNTVATFAIGTDGSLTKVGGDVGTGTLPLGITVDTRERHAYVANRGSNNISVYNIAADGQLTPHPVTPTISTSTGPTKANLDPGGNRLYVTHYAPGVPSVVRVFTVAADGSLSDPGIVTNVGSGATLAQYVRFHPSGKFAYVPDYIGHRVYQYAVSGTDGSLAPIGTGSVAALGEVDDVAIAPSGTYLYAASFGGNGLNQYAIDGTTGELTPLTPDSLTLPGLAYSLAIDPTGAFVYAVCTSTSPTPPAGTNAVYQYSVGTDGTLTALPVTNIAADLGAAAIALSR